MCGPKNSRKRCSYWDWWRCTQPRWRSGDMLMERRASPPGGTGETPVAPPYNSAWSWRRRRLQRVIEVCQILGDQLIAVVVVVHLDGFQLVAGRMQNRPGRLRNRVQSDARDVVASERLGIGAGAVGHLHYGHRQITGCCDRTQRVKQHFVGMRSPDLSRTQA